MTFFFGLHFIALYCGGQKFGQPRGGVKFAKSSPQSRKMTKNGQFCRITPSMLNIDLHPWLWYHLVEMCTQSYSTWNLNLHYTRDNTTQRVTSGEISLHGSASGRLSCEETSRRWRAVGDTVFKLTSPGIGPRPLVPIAFKLVCFVLKLSAFQFVSINLEWRMEQLVMLKYLALVSWTPTTNPRTGDSTDHEDGPLKKE